MLLSTLLLALSLWWFIDQLSGDGFNAATLYHLASGIEGAGTADFIRPILGLAALSLASLLPLLRMRMRGPVRLQRGRAAGIAFAALFAVVLAGSPLADDARRLYQQSRPVDPAQVAAGYAVPTRALRERRNIVWIYAESLERTYLDPGVFPGLMPDLSRLAGESLTSAASPRPTAAAGPSPGWCRRCAACR